MVDNDLYFEDDLQDYANDDASAKNIVAMPVADNPLKLVLFLDSQKKWIDKQGNARQGFYGQIRDEQNMIELLELAIAGYDDYLLAEAIEPVAGAQLPQKGFNADFAKSIINNQKADIKLLIAKGLIGEFVKLYPRKIIFLQDGSEIISALCLRDFERGYSADLAISIRGTQRQKIKALKYWRKNKAVILQNFATENIKRIYVETALAKKMVEVIMRGQDHAVRSMKLLRTGKFNGKIITYKQFLIETEKIE